MNNLFLHPTHAEDQPHAHAILTIHVLRAGLSAGSILSIASASLTTLFSRKPHTKTLTHYFHRLIVHGSRGAVGGILLSGIMLTATMWGKEDVEWKDRAWRLLASNGQNEADRWIGVGGLVGGAAMAVGLARRGKGVKAIQGVGIGTGAVGGVGLGAAAGFVGSMAWRKGVFGGKF